MGGPFVMNTKAEIVEAFRDFAPARSARFPGVRASRSEQFGFPP